MTQRTSQLPGFYKVTVAERRVLVSEATGVTAQEIARAVDGGGLDKAVFVGLKKVKGENLGNRGRSDHPVKIWTFEA